MASKNPMKRPSEDPGVINEETRVCKRLETVKEYLDQKQWKPYAGSSASDAKIRRWRYGVENAKKPKKTILMLGETGTGKTTLLNTLVNYVMGVKFEDNLWNEITGEQPQDSSASQTACVTVYEIHVQKSLFSLTIIDTPGYGDTRGEDHDKVIANHLCELFDSYSGINTIDAVGLVVKASQNRLTDFQHYIFRSVLSLFGKDIENNIVIFITHSDGLDATDALNAVKMANTRCAKDEEGDPIHFLFNNRQCEPYKKKQAKAYSNYWRLGEESIEEFFEHIKDIKAQSLKMTTDVMKKRKDLQTKLSKLMANIGDVKVDEKKLEQAKKNVQRFKDKLANNENFTYVEEVTSMQKVPIKDHYPHSKENEKAMCCDVCKKNCHFPGCTYVVRLWWCEVMKRGICKKCGCSHEVHSKQTMFYKLITETVTKTKDDLKKEYEARYGKNVNLQENIEKDLTKRRHEMFELIQEAFDVIIELDKIALHGESLTINADFDILMEKLKETNQDDKVEKLKEIMAKFPPPRKGKISK